MKKNKKKKQLNTGDVGQCQHLLSAWEGSEAVQGVNIGGGATVITSEALL